MGNPEEASDEDASDIHNNEDVFYFNTESGFDQKSTPHKEQLHRLLLDKQGVLEKSEDLPEIVLSWEFGIDFETAKAFRKSGGNYLRAKQWEDLTVEVRIS